MGQFDEHAEELGVTDVHSIPRGRWEVD